MIDLIPIHSPDSSPSEELKLQSILTQTSILTSIPSSDPIDVLLSSHQLSTFHHLHPTQEDSVKDEHHQLQSLLLNHSWRALIKLTHHQILKKPPSPSQTLFKLWSIRLESLNRLHLIQNLSHELKSLLKTLIYQHVPIHRIPFSILILRARLDSLRSPSSIDSNLRTCENIVELIQASKRTLWYHQQSTSTSSKEDEVIQQTWKSRISWLNDLLINLLSHPPLSSSPHHHLHHSVSPTSHQLQTSIEMGDLSILSPLIITSSPASPSHLSLLLHIARGEWSEAIKQSKEMLNDASKELSTDQSVILRNTLAIALLYDGKLNQALETMEQLISSRNDDGSHHLVEESLIFNYATLLELGSSMAQDSKLQLLTRLAAEGRLEDGINPEVFKLA